MNQLMKQLLCITIMVSAAHLDATTTNIVPRSQSFDAARQMVGWNNPEWGINRKSPDDRYYYSFNLTFAYTRTFRDNRLADYLFGNDLVCGDCGDTAINISGAAVEERGANDWLADYFGLPVGYRSSVSFKPTISNFLLDFSFYAGLDAWLDGLYFRIHSPFVHTKWNLNAKENIEYPASNAITDALNYEGIAYIAGYMAGANVPAENTTASFLAYANGATPTIASNGYQCETGLIPRVCETPSTIWQPLCCSRILNSCDCDNDCTTRNGFGEIRFVLGRNFFSEDDERDCHIGIGAYAAAPTGTRVGESRYLFAPIVGNGKHWELGGQVTAHHIWWRSEDENKTIGVYLEANVTHLFGANQTRCFDLCSAGSSSRYMLAQKLTTFDPINGSGLTLATSVDGASLEFANEYAPVANITRRDIVSTIDAQGDLAISLSYRHCNFQWDVGYNFWGRSCEKLRMSTDCCPVIQEPWALKGTAFVYGFDATSSPQPYEPVPLAASDSTATIHGGTNTLAPFTSTHTTFNQLIDNSVPAIDNDGHPLLVTLTGSQQTYTSNPPVLIDEADFNMTGTRGISNKFFTNFTYAYPEFRETIWTPYASFGAEVEFGSGSKNNRECEINCENPCESSSCNTSCNEYPTESTCAPLNSCCSNCALTQWGVWFKVGASYN